MPTMVRRAIHKLNYFKYILKSHIGVGSGLQARGIAETRGLLDGAEIVDGVLKLKGWVVSLSDRAIDGLRVTLASEDLTGLEVDKGLPSPDIKTRFTAMAGADRCRFQIRAHLTAEQQERARTSLIICTPMVGGLEGCILVNMTEPSIPIPDEEDLRYIHTNVFDQPMSDDPRTVFCGTSAEFAGYFIQLADLKPDSSVLEVGCGLGRMAYMLTRYLDPTSSRYEGFDIIDRLIEWAQKSISARHPNFHFRKVEVYNELYNPGGTLRPSEFRFPYEDKSFDFIFMTSVFTHMLGPEVRHYLDEIHRVLRPGGRLLITCMLLNGESEALMRMGKSKTYLLYPAGEGYTSSPERPEKLIGFKERQLLHWTSERGFTLRGKHYGDWSGRSNGLSFQDILIF